MCGEREGVGGGVIFLVWNDNSCVVCRNSFS